MNHAPPSPSPGTTDSPMVTPTVVTTPSPTTLPVTGSEAENVGWFVLAAIALVVMGVALMALVGRIRRAHVH
jgi:hypothetical protein